VDSYRGIKSIVIRTVLQKSFAGVLQKKIIEQKANTILTTVLALISLNAITCV